MRTVTKGRSRVTRRRGSRSFIVLNVIENHFNACGDVVATVKGTEEVVWVLDKHAIAGHTRQAASRPSIALECSRGTDPALRRRVV